MLDKQHVVLTKLAIYTSVMYWNASLEVQINSYICVVVINYQKGED
jgi:hypothetical protein